MDSSTNNGLLYTKALYKSNVLLSLLVQTTLCGMDNATLSPCGMDNSPCGMNSTTPSPCGMDNSPCGTTPSPCGMHNSPCGMNSTTPSPCEMGKAYGMDTGSGMPSHCYTDNNGLLFSCKYCVHCLFLVQHNL